MSRKDDRYDDSYDLLNQYLQEIARIPRLNPDEEKELGRRVQENDSKALEQLVKANLRFVVSYAKRFRNAHVLFLDLINEGNIGLIHAAKKFDPDKNVKFITYAVWWIRQAILHALSEQGGAFRLPPKRANLMYRLSKAMATAMTEQNRIPTPDELAAELGVPLRDVQTLLHVNAENFSLSSELDNESHTELSDLIEQTTVPSAEDELEEQSAREDLLDRIAKLSPKERLVLTLRHGVSDNVPMKIRRIGEFLNRPVEEVAQLLDSAIRQMCETLRISETELSHLLLFTNPNSKASWTFWVALGDLPPDWVQAIDPERADTLEELKQHGAVQTAVAALDLEERTVLQLRYGILQDEELTLRDIGEILNLSRERVRQIEARAEAKCRRSVHRDLVGRG
ncbi:MAG: sigma-70 family RNA polymerase sigma factor [Thermoanaerobaculia bacterium]